MILSIPDVPELKQRGVQWVVWSVLVGWQCITDLLANWYLQPGGNPHLATLTSWLIMLKVFPPSEDIWRCSPPSGGSRLFSSCCMLSIYSCLSPCWATKCGSKVFLAERCKKLSRSTRKVSVGCGGCVWRLLAGIFRDLELLRAKSNLCMLYSSQGMCSFVSPPQDFWGGTRYWGGNPSFTCLM